MSISPRGSNYKGLGGIAQRQFHLAKLLLMVLTIDTEPVALDKRLIACISIHACRNRHRRPPRKKVNNRPISIC
jgi:hypothetical protein